MERKTKVPVLLKVFFPLFVLIFVFSCSFKTKKVIWPTDDRKFTAYCEIETSFKDLSFSGYLTLELDYPNFYAEVSGPFGNTLMIIKKQCSSFKLDYGNGNEKGDFKKLFSFPVEEVVYDIALAPFYLRTKEELSVIKESYRVTYHPWGKKPKICWENQDGSMCLSFMEVK